MSMVANCHVEYDIGEHLKSYVVPFDLAVAAGLPQEAVDDLRGTLANTEGYFDLGLSERLPMRGVVALHRTFGWITFVPDPDPNTEPAILWYDRKLLPPHIFALACVYCPRWGQPDEPREPISPELAAIVDDLLTDL